MDGERGYEIRSGRKRPWLPFGREEGMDIILGPEVIP